MYKTIGEMKGTGCWEQCENKWNCLHDHDFQTCYKKVKREKPKDNSGGSKCGYSHRIGYGSTDCGASGGE